MRFLFTTIQFEESAFYGRVGRELAARGHECSHLTISRLAIRGLRKITAKTLDDEPKWRKPGKKLLTGYTANGK